MYVWLQTIHLNTYSSNKHATKCFKQLSRFITNILLAIKYLQLMTSTLTLIIPTVLKWKCNYSSLNCQENVAKFLYKATSFPISWMIHVLSYRINPQQIRQGKNIILDHTKTGQHLCCTHGFTAHSLLHPAKPHSASCITDNLVLIFPAVQTTNTLGMSHLVLLITIHTRCIWR